MKVKNLHWLWLSVAIIVADQVTKILVRHYLALGASVEVTPFFNLVHARNYGAAFSFLDIAGGHQRWFFAALSFILSLVLIAWLYNLEPKRPWRSAALALMIGGALGHFWGRLTAGHVTGFLDFHWKLMHWPEFNVADSAVCVGAGILIICLAWNKR